MTNISKITVGVLDNIVLELNKLHGSLNMPWRQIALEPDFRGIPHSTLRDIANGIEPKGKEIRAQLGLPEIVELEVCPSCGIVHTKVCPKKRVIKPKRIQDMSKEELLWALENRKEF